MSGRVVVPAAVRAALDEHAREAAPEEACGVLFGTPDPRSRPSATTVRVRSHRRVPNVADRPRTRYELDPGAVLDAFDATDGPAHEDVGDASDGDEDPADEGVGDASDADEGANDASDADAVVGFYHSHPRGPAVPSATDRAQATWPGYVYCIVVPGEGAGAASGGSSDDRASDSTVRAWRWTGDEFDPSRVVDG